MKVILSNSMRDAIDRTKRIQASDRTPVGSTVRFLGMDICRLAPDQYFIPDLGVYAVTIKQAENSCRRYCEER